MGRWEERERVSQGGRWKGGGKMEKRRVAGEENFITETYFICYIKYPILYLLIDLLGCVDKCLQINFQFTSGLSVLGK